ncbi:hypothetical protein EGW08_012841, partial [Elysia chlorotica]
MVKHVLQVFLGERRALHVADGADLFRQAQGVRLGDGLLLVLRELDEHLDVVAEVALRAHQDERRPGPVPADLGNPLLQHVVEGGRRHDAEAQQEDVRAGVAQGPDRVEVVL